ncbi:hypothetical protein [Paenibacillus solanacearum]|nr:hypothetical protein [Paenibacillus solanacearum]
MKGWTGYLLNERGGVHVLLFGLMGMIFSAFVWVTAFNWMLQTNSTNKTKSLLDHATRAAALNLIPAEAALGRIVWDPGKGTADFYRYLQLNLKLDGSLVPLPGSHLKERLIVHRLEHVTNPSYPYVLSRSLTLYSGTSDAIVRQVQVTIYGPSIVAIIEVRQPLLGYGRREPIVLSSVASMRFR